jgi:hypothetical protein
MPETVEIVGSEMLMKSTLKDPPALVRKTPAGGPVVV